MYQSLLLSMLYIVLHLLCLSSRSFNISDMMYSIRVIAEDTASISTKQCSDANIPVHLVILRTRTFRCLQNYEQSIPFTTFKDDDVILRHITKKKISCLQLYYEQSIPFATFKTIVFLFVHVLPCHITNKEDIQQFSISTVLLRTFHSVCYS